MFYCEFCEISKNIFFIVHFWTTASVSDWYLRTSIMIALAHTIMWNKRVVISISDISSLLFLFISLHHTVYMMYFSTTHRPPAKYSLELLCIKEEFIHIILPLDPNLGPAKLFIISIFFSVLAIQKELIMNTKIKGMLVWMDVEEVIRVFSRKTCFSNNEVTRSQVIIPSFQFFYQT